MLHGKLLTESELKHKCDIERAAKEKAAHLAVDKGIVISETSGDHIASMLLRGLGEYARRRNLTDIKHKG